jgi:hypothetical protein
MAGQSIGCCMIEVVHKQWRIVVGHQDVGNLRANHSGTDNADQQSLTLLVSSCAIHPAWW